MGTRTPDDFSYDATTVMNVNRNPHVTPSMVIALTTTFQRHHIAHCFIGHVAVNYWGYHRGFSQLEILVSGDQHMHSSIIEALTDIGIAEQVMADAWDYQIVRLISPMWFLDIYTRTNDGNRLTPQMIHWTRLNASSVPVMRLLPLIAHMEAAGNHYPQNEYVIELNHIREILRSEPKPLDPRKFLGKYKPLRTDR